MELKVVQGPNNSKAKGVNRIHYMELKDESLRAVFDL